MVRKTTEQEGPPCDPTGDALGERADDYGDAPGPDDVGRSEGRGPRHSVPGSEASATLVRLRIVQWSIAWRHWVERHSWDATADDREARNNARCEVLEARDNLVSAYLDADKPQDAWAALKAMQFLIERYGLALSVLLLALTCCSVQDHGAADGTGNIIYAETTYPSGGTGGAGGAGGLEDLGGAGGRGELGGALGQGGRGELGGVLGQAGLEDLGGAGGLELVEEGGLEDLGGAGGLELVEEGGLEDLGGAGGLEDLGSAGGLEAPPDLGELAIAAMPAGYTAAGDLRVGLSAGEWLSALFPGEPGRCYQVAAACDAGGLEVALFGGGEQVAHAVGPTLATCVLWSGPASLLEARGRCSGRIAFVPAVER
jgi:hypothetical protein